MSWAAFPDQSGYPTKFYTSLNERPGQRRTCIRRRTSSRWRRPATLPQVCYVWSPVGLRRASAAGERPDYVTQGPGPGLAARAGGDRRRRLGRDHVHPHLGRLGRLRGLGADARHRDGAGCAPPGRLPGRSAARASRCSCSAAWSRRRIDPEWHSHASIPKTIIDLLGLPAMGVARVDDAPSLAHLVDPSLSRPVPPAPGTTIVQPTPPIADARAGRAAAVAGTAQTPVPPSSPSTAAPARADRRQGEQEPAEAAEACLIAVVLCAG